MEDPVNLSLYEFDHVIITKLSPPEQALRRRPPLLRPAPRRPLLHLSPLSADHLPLSLKVVHSESLWNNQQGNYQPQQNPPPGFSNKGNQSSQQQANPSTSTPQESSTDVLLKQILESQTRSEKQVGYELKNLHSKIDGSYNELNNKFRALENQFTSMTTHQNRQQGSLPGKPDQEPKEYCNVVLSTTSSRIELSNHKKEVDEIERLVFRLRLNMLSI
ncbi:hypothetical protein F2Q68_00017729 [Brassica cretica]|uniref:Uncharacterized protein n=1 Tax=Brassica cretica TaxID=69181 RepID=A0A8S9HP32_BRACR|nr:hypothetical protein F2Q68_00017729 [Brassica cretica]